MRYPTLFISFLTSLFLCAQEPCDASLNIASPSCPDEEDGSINVVTGAGGPFTYVWLHDPSINGPLATGLGIGPYTVLVTDTSGCFSILEGEVENPIVPALGVMTTTDITCAGNDDGTITFTVNPGPYTWNWLHAPTETSTVLTGLGPGMYTVVINGGECPSYVAASLGDPDIVIEGAYDYCPSAPPVLTTLPQWGFHPHVYEWSTGDSTSGFTVVPGTDGTIELTATDTVIGCVVTASVTVTALPYPTVTFAAPDTLCLRTTGVATVLTSTADSLVWLWGDNGLSHLESPTLYFDDPLWQPISLQGFDSLGCGDVPMVDSIFILPRLPATFFAEQVPCTHLVDIDLRSTADSCAFFIGDSLVFNDCSGFIRWDVGDYDEFDFTFHSTQPNECHDTSSVSIDVRTVPVLFLPNTFTPNGDGFNDTWPGPVDIPDDGWFQMQLFDRWGTSLWSTIDSQEKWDGSTHPDGVYVYTMRMRDPCSPQDEITSKGFVLLMR
ncbi:MAG TPA: gliding motility-associated C-terminal domain-containing protein [Flavobacteriales bacterium]